jgi:hypothetical protein
MNPAPYLFLLPHNLPHFVGFLTFVLLLFGFNLLLYFHVLQEIGLIVPPVIIENLHEFVSVFAIAKIHFRPMIVD